MCDNALKILVFSVATGAPITEAVIEPSITTGTPFETSGEECWIKVIPGLFTSLDGRPQIYVGIGAENSEFVKPLNILTQFVGLGYAPPELGTPLPKAQ